MGVFYRVSLSLFGPHLYLSWSQLWIDRVVDLESGESHNGITNKFASSFSVDERKTTKHSYESGERGNSNL
jgi:hypothetical protein